MVVQGSFSVKLINASTMMPYADHASSTGKVFVSMKPHDDFFVHLEQVHGNLLVVDERVIFYKTFVSSNSCKSTNTGSRKNNFKRTSRGGDTERNVFRFETTTTQPYESMAREKVTVRIYERLSSSHCNKKGSVVMSKRRRLLESVTIHCLVISPDLPKVDQMMAIRDSVVTTSDATTHLSLTSMDVFLQSKQLTSLQSPSWLMRQTCQYRSNPLLASRIMPEKLHQQPSLRLIL
jgi:hypothetical protein